MEPAISSSLAYGNVNLTVGASALSRLALVLITGTPLRQALVAAGLEGRRRLRIDPSSYLETHIEQGDYLDAHDLSLGIVTDIVGIWQYRITLRVQRNHAGTTRMAIRKDAAAIALMHQIE